LDGRGEPFLADFGLARLLDVPGMTESGVFLGTPDYASPEQARRQPSDERSDLYSLGVLMFEMATGKRPFVAESRERVLQMQVTATPPAPRALRPDLPEPLAAIILRCLEKEPARRYQTAQFLQAELNALQPR
ncbi:MAG TPA: serine/threonine-protein kinase, partial [Candidatus Polarisedimenticolia bacterium]|nr:serine/threonine-protein kinase [Candidatus Polarisedimenticolia bacterium]